MFANTPEPPYYAVIFTSEKNSENEGYEVMAEKMWNLAKQQPGFLGAESARNEIGITVSYWENLESIKQWKLNEEHLLAQENGKKFWYKNYKVRICLVQRDYQF